MRIALEQTPPETGRRHCGSRHCPHRRRRAAQGVGPAPARRNLSPITVVEDPLSTVVMGTGRALDNLNELGDVVFMIVRLPGRRLSGPDPAPCRFCGLVHLRLPLDSAADWRALLRTKHVSQAHPAGSRSRPVDASARYSWNQRTHILDNFAANTGLEASGVVLKSVRMVQDTVMRVEPLSRSWTCVRRMTSLRSRSNSSARAADGLGGRRTRPLAPPAHAYAAGMLGARVLAGRMGANSALASVLIGRGVHDGGHSGRRS